MKRDSIFATLFTIVVVVLLGLFALNTSIFNPFKKAFEDFRYTDIYYSRMKKSKTALYPEIVLVNIGRLNRAELAHQIEIINQYKPRVIGVDAFFSGPRDKTGDSLLAAVINKSGNIILANKYENYDSRKKTFHDLQRHYNLFRPAGTGFSNIGSDYGKTSTIRYYISHVKDGDDTLFSFATAVSLLFDPSLKKDILRHNRLQTILYSATSDNFTVIDTREAFAKKEKLELVRNRIVLMGYLGEPVFSLNDIEDKHFTPFNDKISGRSIPDMYGVTINANIIRMQLEGVHMHNVYTWVNYLLSFIILWLHMGLFIYLYMNYHRWYHVTTKIIQLVSSSLFLLIVFFSYHLLHLNFDPAFLVIAILLSVDLLGYYQGLMSFLSRWFGIKSVLIN